MNSTQRNDKKFIGLSNPRAERILLGGLIASNFAYWSIAHAVRPDAFTVPLHRQLYEVLADIIMAGGSTTLPLICARLPEQDKDENGTEVSVRSYLSVCIDQAEQIGPMDIYEEVAELASKRRLMRLSEEIAKQVKKGDRRSDEIASDLETQATDIMHIASPNRPKRLSEVSKRVIANSRLARDTGEVQGLKFGLAAMDELFGMMTPGDLGCILASQSDGKSALAQQIGIHASLKKPVLMIQMEMSDEQVAAREVSFASDISGHAILHGSVNAFDFEKVEGTQKIIENYDFFIHDSQKMSVRQIKGHAQAMKRTKGLGLLIIDQLDKIKSERYVANKFDRMTEVTADLKDLAKELKIPVIVLAQRTRMAQRNTEVPDVNDAEAPSLEKDCDWLCGLWRPENWLQKSKPTSSSDTKMMEWEEDMRVARNKANIIVLKRRSGARFVQKAIGWRGEVTRFHDI